MIGLADAIWTSARLYAILIGHACRARCGARCRAEPASRDRRRACLGKGHAYPNIRLSVREPSRAAASISATHYHRLDKARGSSQAHNRAIYARIFRAIDN
jgi:hypothetical protein